MAHARQLERLEFDSVVSLPFLDEKFLGRQAAVAEADPYSARVGLVALRGSLTVASSHKLVAVIAEDIKDHEVVIFDFSGTSYLDDSAAMVIEQLLGVATKEGTAYILMSFGYRCPHPSHPQHPATGTGGSGCGNRGRGPSGRL